MENKEDIVDSTDDENFDKDRDEEKRHNDVQNNFACRYCHLYFAVSYESSMTGVCMDCFNSVA